MSSVNEGVTNEEMVHQQNTFEHTHRGYDCWVYRIFVSAFVANEIGGNHCLLDSRDVNHGQRCRKNYDGDAEK